MAAAKAMIVLAGLFDGKALLLAGPDGRVIRETW